ncbi:MAG TPA: hypothetical protein VJB14_11065 [Planctomycetota bacterium]|nr:hypothetical protein [Planctomycetota bacterium]
MKSLIASLSLLMVAAQNGKAPSSEEALAWLKSLDAKPESAQKQPRFPALTVDDLKTMKEIRLGGHRASDGKHVFIDPAGFKNLLALPALEKANLVEIDGFTDEALVPIGKLSGLKELNLGDAGVTNAGLKHLSGLKELTRLDLGWTKDVGDAGMPLLAKLKKLEFLGLGGTKVTDAGLPALAALPNLKEVALMGTAVTDQGLQSLAACKGLASVLVGKKGKVTQAGMDRLKKALPACTVMIK